MENKIITNKCILVPHDFTEVGDFAVEHAYLINKKDKRPIHVVHVVKKTKEIEIAKIKLTETVEKIKQEKNLSDTEFVIFVCKGNFYKEFYKYGVEQGAYLAVMGTHGIKNVKKAMKVVKKFVKIPFILVQSPATKGVYENVLLPIDTDKSNRIKSNWVNYLNTLFQSKAFILSYEEKETTKVKDLRNNLNFITDFFNEQLIDYDFKSLPTKKDFSNEIYNYASEINADIILLMTDKYRYYVKELKKAENIELYKKIPIMCVNKRTDIGKIGGFN